MPTTPRRPSRPTTVPSAPAWAALPLLALLAACGQGGDAGQAANVPSTAPTAVADAEQESTPEPAEETAAAVPTVPGYAPGDVPPVPLFQLPDLSLLNNSADAFTVDVARDVESVPGVTVTPAHCDEDGAVVASDGAVLAYGGGGVASVDGSSSVTNDGDGSGTYVDGSTSITNDGDGSGTYVDGTTSITNDGDGSGTFVSGDLSITVEADGSGTYVDDTVSITIEADGSGTYVDDTVSITNEGDGSGTYVDETVNIVNDGQGTALVNGVEVPADPLPPVPRLGAFPPVEALAPVESCGTTISLDSGVLFDFDRAEVRPDASVVLDGLARILTDAAVPTAEISGHTDSVASDDYNQDLSERRAAAVVAALADRAVPTGLDAVGYGESRPVAPNEVDGQDNPAGRQLNRRVEVFVPAF
jgi:OOP family OmpA-OmpF porin